ncbi:MAG: nuclear transport factor 2 family protein [Piscinibacter sp.]
MRRFTGVHLRRPIRVAMLRVVANDLPHSDCLKTVYSAFARGDVQALMALFSETCEVTVVGNPALNIDAGTRSGTTGLQDLFTRFHADFKIREFVLERIIVDGDNAAVHWWSKLELRRTGKIIDSERCKDLVTFRRPPGSTR